MCCFHGNAIKYSVGETITLENFQFSNEMLLQDSERKDLQSIMKYVQRYEKQYPLISPHRVDGLSLSVFI